MQEGFLPLVQYRGMAGASYRHRDEPEFQIDFLTPRVADDDEPVVIEHLDIALQPLRFMAFFLEDVQQATMFDPTGRCVVVSLPAPQRYATHKLLIVGERTGAFKAKLSKDLAQAASLAEYFIANDPDALAAAWDDALSRGPGWRKRAREGRKALGVKAPELAAALAWGPPPRRFEGLKEAPPAKDIGRLTGRGGGGAIAQPGRGTRAQSAARWSWFRTVAPSAAKARPAVPPVPRVPHE